MFKALSSYIIRSNYILILYLFLNVNRYGEDGTEI